MKVLIAPQSFKGSISAIGAARAIERGIKFAVPDIECVLLPMADGGDGTVEALVNATAGQFRRTMVEGPLGNQVSAEWGILGDGRAGPIHTVNYKYRGTAVIEMAAASGLRLVEVEKRNPLEATTYGTGQLIKAALDEGSARIVIGLGGSATNDGGAGALQALGVRLLAADGNEIARGGAALASLAKIDSSELDPRLAKVEILIASDVTNPLVGTEGASQIYGPQKGASPAMVRELEAALEHYGRVIRDQVGIDISNRPGAGAAGGIGAGLMAFLNVRLIPGARLVMQILEFEKHLDGVDLVVTGEGQIDGQTIYGKAPIAVARAAKERGLPVVAIVGSIGEGYRAVYEHGIGAVLNIVPRPMELAAVLDDTERLLEDAAERMMRLALIGRG